ncbi:hypothetical protein WJX81_005982 [Elliptochloris bilobata]|uniref:Flavanone 4-reductase n=1 Tax=Elliptochloris bilobata TaxID=381761 RepID=A0AAW1S9K5_9CHLO
MAFIAVVTGGSGFVGTEVVKQLLEKGYTVRATVRSTSNKQKVAHLTALGDALPGKLELHEADLLKEGSFDAAVKGVHFVFHTASPFFRTVEDGQRDLVDPAVKGTKNVLSAVAKSLDTVKRVVLTSSFAAVVKSRKGPTNGKTYSEEDWNVESSVDDEPYRYSKVAAERVAWDMAKEHGFHLCVINPSFVLGPVISSRTDATSIDVFKAFIENRDDSGIIPWIIDIRDIGRAHVRAAEVPTAQGRFLVSNPMTVSSKVANKALSKAFPNYTFPPGKDEPPKVVIDNSKVLKELGMQLHPVEETFVDMARTLIALGIAKPVKE